MARKKRNARKSSNSRRQPDITPNGGQAAISGPEKSWKGSAAPRVVPPELKDVGKGKLPKLKRSLSTTMVPDVGKYDPPAPEEG